MVSILQVSQGDEHATHYPFITISGEGQFLKQEGDNKWYDGRQDVQFPVDFEHVAQPMSQAEHILPSTTNPFGQEFKHVPPWR